MAVLNRIGQSVNVLRSLLQIPCDDFDNQAASGIAASVQNVTERLEIITKRWLETERQSFTND